MLDNLSINQRKILGVIGIVATILLGIFFYNKINTKDEIDLNEDILIKNEIEQEEMAKEEKEIIIVHITGAVKTPGVVRLPEGSRIEDAIEAAGGLTEDGDISNVNLAYILEDGTKIRIPSNDEHEEIETKNGITEENDSNIIEKNENQTSSAKEININKATTNELQTLPGIGPSLALKILQYREKNGKFNEIEEIKKVSGVGDSKYENIKSLICVK